MLSDCSLTEITNGRCLILIWGTLLLALALYCTFSAFRLPPHIAALNSLRKDFSFLGMGKSRNAGLIIKADVE